MISVIRTRARLFAVAGAALIMWCAGIFAPSQSAAAASYVPISGAGSTWSYNAIHEWITDVAQFGMTVNYADVGSSTGRSEFAQGTVDWGASEIPYGVQDGNNYDPPPNRGYAYMPDTAGGTTFMYNLTIGNQRVTNLRLSGATIAGIFTNKITMWNDPAIVADNPGLTLPAIRIIPVVRSDGSGATAEFTQWMVATQPSAWNAYCQVVGRNPCTQTSTYPVQPGTAMVGQAGDLGVSGYVSQQQADGAIGYVEFSYALETGFPVALVLNAAGYYTEPTPENVAVSLLKAQINENKGSADYLTQDLSQVYTDTDPRTYELSNYSYMILPTDTSFGLSSAKGYTLGAFGSYLLCQGQQQVDQLGYSALPINLVEAGYAQLQQVPGNQVASASSSFIQSCDNPTFSTNGTNTLADEDPQPPACDKQGPTQCTTATGGAAGSGGANGSTASASSSPSASSSTSSSSSSSSSSTSSSSSPSPSAGNGSSSSSSSHAATSSTSSAPSSSKSSAASSGSGSTTGASGATGSTSTTGTNGATDSTSTTGTSGGVVVPNTGSSCDPNTGICVSSGNPAAVGGSTSNNGTSTGTTTTASGPQIVNGEPVAAGTSLGDGVQVMLMALAAALLVGIGLVPPLIAQGNTRRRRRGSPPNYPTDYR
jgi:phosphate transport system substrate-binding protein